MYDNETKDKFVELRAAGKSFGDISQELGVVKSTLHRWEEERADDIARLRRIQWEETEKSLGRRLEDQLEGLACDLLDYEQTLGNFNLAKLSVRETLMILRETRRAYFQTRALLMGTAPRPRPRKPAASVTPDPRAEPRCETKPNSKGLTRPDPLDSTNPQPANAVHNPATDQSEISNLRSEIARSTPPESRPSASGDVSAPVASSRLCVEPPSETKSNETERFQQNGTTQHRNTNDLQQRAAMSFDFSGAPDAAAKGPQGAVHDRSQIALEGGAPRRQVIDDAPLPRGEGQG
jgi:hypothetical protein